MFGATKKINKGTCEVCEKPDVFVTVQHGNILMCEKCAQTEQTAIEETNKMNAVVEKARKVDTQIELKQDIFNAATVSFVELSAAIENDTAIPADQKQFALMTEIAARIDKMSAEIFEIDAIALEKKNTRHAWLVNAQNVAAKLRVEQREKFKQYDVNYKPVSPKSIKPKAVKAPSTRKPFNKKELYDAASKYHVPAAQVQSIIVSRNMSAEDAAKHLAGLMGLL